PNPFNPNTSLRYELPMATDVVLVVYDILGREVIRLVDEHKDAGYHQVIWQGQDRFGRSVSSGVYITRLVTRQYTKARKMVLLK
ncbi:MAG: T9SS type A sorting domain-containing protein, partial [Candidatus Marinimicrobia bacterium]|nr:T9SS type A sorting domain-containing protein [Candidatus Neomarinimicrobiota bacterium]